MGAAFSTMADVTVMEKQLVAKTRQNAELQGKLTDKMRRLHDLEQDLERKDRSIYFLERDMDSRSRTLGKLRLRSNNLEQLAAKQGFAAHIDDGEAKLAVAMARLESYRVDAIFRVFSLKGQGRILQQDINAAVNKKRDQLGIKQRYHHTRHTA